MINPFFKKAISAFINKNIFIYLFLIVLIEIAFAGISLYELQMRIITDQVSVDFLSHLPSFFWFFFRLFLLYAFVGLFLSLTGYLFKVKNSFFILLPVILYLLLYNSLMNPQVVEEIPYLNDFIHRTIYIPHINYSPMIGIFFIFALWLNIFKYRKELEPARFFGCLLLSLTLFHFIFNMQDLPKFEIPKPIKDQTQHAKEQTPNIILISVDALRPDTPYIANPDDDSFTSRFLKKSLKFKRAISTVALTNASFTSILSGKDSATSQIKGTFETFGRSGIPPIENSKIEELKKSGYSTDWLSDDIRYLHTIPNFPFDGYHGPPQTLANFVVPLLIPKVSFWGLFNNSLGFFFLPEAKTNFAFEGGYEPIWFTNKSIDLIHQLQNKQQPFFLAIHNAGLHWPGSFRFPFYPLAEGSSEGNFAYSKILPQAKNSVLPATGGSRVLSHKEIYELGTRMVKAKFLEPMFEYLEGSGLLENSIVILMSDHGDALWNEYGLPINKIPSHGRYLIASDDSNLATLAIYAPGKKAQTVDRNISLKDVISTSLEFYNSSSPVASFENLDSYLLAETGFWPELGFHTQSMIVQGANTLGSFVWDEVSHNLLLTSDALEASRFQRQRAAFWKEYRLSLFPTWEGYRIFLCNLDMDPKCRKNLILENKAITQNMLAFILKKLENEKRDGHLPDLKWTQVNNKLSWDFPKEPNQLLDRPSLLIQASLESTFRYENPEYSLKALALLKEQNSKNRFYAQAAETNIGIICSQPSFDPNKFSQCLKSTSQQGLKSLSKPSKFESKLEKLRAQIASPQFDPIEVSLSVKELSSFPSYPFYEKDIQKQIAWANLVHAKKTKKTVAEFKEDWKAIHVDDLANDLGLNLKEYYDYLKIVDGNKK